MIRSDVSDPPVSLAEAQAYVRIETGEEEAVLAGLLRSASAMCEQFIGQTLVAHGFDETLRATSQWQRLGLTPVRSIGAVAQVAEDGSENILPADAFAIDVDASGDGWVRLVGAVDTALIKVSAVAGMAEGSNGVPEPLRQGIVRLTAHLFNARDGDGGEPPAAVTALWRPYRRMRLT